MITKKKAPWGIMYSVLFCMLIGAYFVSGIFTFPDVILFNYGEKLIYVVFHPFRIWWNDKTLMVMGTACILWLMGVSYFLTYYRDYHFGKEHGTADWAEIHSKRKELADPDPMRTTIISRNISIGFDALSNMNLLIIGGSGSGKTSGILITNIQNSVTPPDAQKGDPFWQDGCGLYLQSMFEYEWVTPRRDTRKLPAA